MGALRGLTELEPLPHWEPLGVLVEPETFLVLEVLGVEEEQVELLVLVLLKQVLLLEQVGEQKEMKALMGLRTIYCPHQVREVVLLAMEEVPKEQAVLATLEPATELCFRTSS